MAGVKTAISIEKKLFDQVNKLAKELRVSRSHLFSLAVEDYLKRYKSRNLLTEINDAYNDLSSDEEEKITKAMKKKHKKNVENDPW